MTWWHSVVLGIIEGLTEFIPVSSTFHLILATQALGLEQDSFLKLFEVVIQSGAILSIVWMYKDKLLQDDDLKQKLFFSFIPTAIIGTVLYKLIKGYFFINTALQLTVFLLVGFFFLILEKYLVYNKIMLKHDYKNLTIINAITIGIFQALSVIPGFSRSGSIILGMLLLGYNRTFAAEYAFMLSLPTILAATSLDLFQNRELLLSLNMSQLQFLIIGILSAFFSAIWVMRWLIKYLSTHNLEIFAYYRIALTIIIVYLLR